MSPFQLTQNIISALNQANFKWPSGEAIFGRVFSPPRAGYFEHDAVPPFAELVVSPSRDQDEHPADVVSEQTWLLYIFADNATDQDGQAGVVGGNRAGLTTSRGRGILEIEPLVKAQLFNRIGLNARPATGDAQAIEVAGRLNGVAAVRALKITARALPAQNDFAPMQKLLNNGSGGGNVAVTFALPTARYDLIGFTWRRASGSTPPSTPTGGTAGAFVAITSPAQTSFADSPGAGTWSYSFFPAYDQTRDPWTGIGSATPNAWASQQTAQNGLTYTPASLTVTV